MKILMNNMNSEEKESAEESEKIMKKIINERKDNSLLRGVAVKRKLRKICKWRKVKWKLVRKKRKGKVALYRQNERHKL